MECHSFTDALKEVTACVDGKYGNREYILRYYGEIYNSLKQGQKRENLEDAFDGHGMLLCGVLVRCMEKEGKELGHQTSAEEILENLCKRYRPHRDKGNLATRLRNMQNAFEEAMAVFDNRDLSVKENKELLVKKCMSLTMECIKAHIFITTDYQKQEIVQRKEMKMECSQS